MTGIGGGGKNLADGDHMGKATDVWFPAYRVTHVSVPFRTRLAGYDRVVAITAAMKELCGESGMVTDVTFNLFWVCETHTHMQDTHAMLDAMYPNIDLQEAIDKMLVMGLDLHMVGTRQHVMSPRIKLKKQILI